MIHVHPTHNDAGGYGVGSVISESMWQMMMLMLCKPGHGFVKGFALVPGVGLAWSIGVGTAICGGYLIQNTAAYLLTSLLVSGTTNYVWLGVKAMGVGAGYNAREAGLYVTQSSVVPTGVTFYLRLYKIVVSLAGIVTSSLSVKPVLKEHRTVPGWN